MTDAQYANLHRSPGRPRKVQMEGEPVSEAGGPLRPQDDLPQDPPPKPTPSVPRGWYEMEGCPQDGKAVWLMGPEGQFIESVWRNTRRRVCGVWQPHGFWSVRNTYPSRPVEFEPQAWRPVSA
jgi:hypothetical protein